MLLKISLIIGVIWILFSPGQRPEVASAISPLTVPVRSLNVTPELTSAERTRALEDAVARWQAARTADEAEARGACRDGHR